MANRKRLMPWLAVLALGLGCGDGGSGSGAAAEPSPEEVAAVQKANAAGDATDDMTEAASHAIIDSGSGGGSSAKAAPARTAGGIFYAGALSLVVDLDATDASGNDLYPNATGVILVEAAGTVAGDSSAGEVNYAVRVAVLAEAVFTDESGTQVRVGVGIECGFGLKIAWSYTDDLNWTITGTVAGACHVGVVALNLTDGSTASAVVDAELYATCTVSRTLGVYTASCAVAGKKTVVVTDAAGTHVVVIAFAGYDSITVSVDGTVYGPYTRIRLGAVFGIDAD